MASLALTVLTLTLGMFFIFVGQFKVTPKFFPDIHEDMVPNRLTFFLITDECLFFRDENSVELIKCFPYMK